MDSTPRKGRRLKAVNQKSGMIMADAILHTRNVMIPILRPMPFKYSYDTSSSENGRRTLKTQNYRNNPTCSETPLLTLSDCLENSLEVKKNGDWKSEKQSTKQIHLGKTDSSSTKKTSISENSCSSKRLSCKEEDNALQLSNTVLPHSEPSTDDQDLRRARSRSIKLSRKCDLLQMKESQTKHEDIFALLPKIEAPISSVASKLVASSPSQSFYDTIADTISTASTLSVSSFRVENKKTFANIVNRDKSVSSVTSTHLHPSNSEYEINVLHYENDIPPENKFPQFAQSHLKSNNTNFSSVYNCGSAKIQGNNDSLADGTNAIKSYRWDEDRTVGENKYSWEINNWTPPSQRKEREMKITEKNGKSPYDCKIKYSWQVIGTSTQTSYTLLQDLSNSVSTEDNESSYKMCSIKYSWQIIGINTQTSLHDYDDPDYWSGVLLPPSKNCNENKTKIGSDETDAKLQDYARSPEKRLKRYLILNNQQTQTFAEKEVQVPNDYYAKYSWHNFIKQYL